MMSEGITHDNKDVLFKILSKFYRDKSFKVYGLNLPPIKELLPTNLPALSLDEKRSDNIFKLKDDTILIVEFESKAIYKNLLKYGHYAFRVAESYYDGKPLKVIIVVIFTGDVETAQNFLDLGSIKIDFMQVFLSKFDGQKMYEDLKNKVKIGADLSDEETMQFIILPLTKKDDKQKLIEDTIDLAKEIKDETKKDFIIAGILSATDKFIDEDYSKRMKEWIRLTKVARLYEEEKIEAVNEAKIETKREIAQNMLVKGLSIIDIMEITGLTKVQIKELQEKKIDV